MRKCHYCPATEDLRPYGPGGADICYDCATATPEREAEVKQNFLTQLEAAAAADSDGIGMIGLESGPVPKDVIFGREHEDES